MSTVAQSVKGAILARPMLSEALRQGIVSYAALAEKLRLHIERETGKAVNDAAIVMALRRLAEKLDEQKERKVVFRISSELIVKTNLADVTVMKSTQLSSKLEKLYRLVDYNRGDTLNVIHGNYEVSVVINSRYFDKALDILQGEVLINREDDLVSVALHMHKDFVHTPGVLFTIIRKLAWENINIIEVVSTATELTFIIKEKDLTRAYNVLQELVRK